MEEEETKQERREERKRKRREKMPQHGKGLARIYKDAVLKRAPQPESPETSDR